MEQKCVERIKQRDNASIWRDNSSITGKNDDKDERAKIIDEKRDKSRVVDMEHQIKQFKSNAYYKESNDQRSINACQEKVDILEDMM